MAGAEEHRGKYTSLADAAKARGSDPIRHYAIYCDESGVNGTKYLGFGSLWMVWERRGDFAALWRDLREQHFIQGEAKWNRVKTATLPFYKAMVDEFFARNWLMFHCFVVAKADVDLAKHDDDWDLARRKHFTMFLANKVQRFAAAGKRYRIRVDPIPSRYQKADEAAEVILRNIVQRAKRLPGKDVIHSLRAVTDSKNHPGIQMGDVLLGAVMAARQGDVAAGPKLDLIRHVAAHIGWEDLRADTLPEARKFNIWRFWDPQAGTRRPEITRRAIVIDQPRAQRPQPGGGKA